MKNFIDKLRDSMQNPILNVQNIDVEQTTKEQFIAYLFPRIGESINAKQSIQNFDSQFRGKGLAIHRDFYPAMPVVTSPTGMTRSSFIQIPATDSATGLRLFEKCRLLARSTPGIVAGYPLWHLHAGFEYIIQNADSFFEKGIQYIMFYFFNANLHVQYVWLEIISTMNMIIHDISTDEIIYSDWEKIVKQGKMYILLNEDYKLNFALS